MQNEESAEFQGERDGWQGLNQKVFSDWKIQMAYNSGYVRGKNKFEKDEFKREHV